MLIYWLMYIYIHIIYNYTSYQLINQLIIINNHLSIYLPIYLSIYLINGLPIRDIWFIAFIIIDGFLPLLPRRKKGLQRSLGGGADEPGIQVIQVDDLCGQRLTSVKLMVGG